MRKLSVVVSAKLGVASAVLSARAAIVSRTGRLVITDVILVLPLGPCPWPGFSRRRCRSGSSAGRPADPERNGVGSGREQAARFLVPAGGGERLSVHHGVLVGLAQHQRTLGVLRHCH